MEKEHKPILILIKKDFMDNYILESKKEWNGERIHEEGLTFLNTKTYLEQSFPDIIFTYKNHWSYYLKNIGTLTLIVTAVLITLMYLVFGFLDFVSGYDIWDKIFGYRLVVDTFLVSLIWIMSYKIKCLIQYVNFVSERTEYYYEDDDDDDSDTKELNKQN